MFTSPVFSTKRGGHIRIPQVLKLHSAFIDGERAIKALWMQKIASKYKIKSSFENAPMEQN